MTRRRPSRQWCFDAATLSVALARTFRRAGHRRAAIAYLSRAAMWRRVAQETPR